MPMIPKPRRIAVMLDLEWPYKRHSGIFAGAHEYAQQQGWEYTVDEYADDTLPGRRAKSVPYDGVIARATRKLADRARINAVPAVNVWASSPARDLLPGVFVDFAAVGRLRAEHLLSRGLRRFASLIARGSRAQKQEREAFCAAVRAAGCPCASAAVPLHTCRTLARWRSTESAIAGWMRNWRTPIGVYVGSETVGRIVVQMCRTRQLRVPADVAIIAGQNEETLCEHPRPSLSSVEVGHERVGREAARLLGCLMDGEPPPTQPILLPPRGLVVRESTDFYAVDDELVAAALEFIAAESHLSVGPDDVARAVNAGTRTLQRRFQKYLDRSVAAEIRRVRIERAKRELAQSDRPLSQIARAVGFGNTMRMYEVFRRELGIAPRDYRKQRGMDAGVD